MAAAADSAKAEAEAPLVTAASGRGPEAEAEGDAEAGRPLISQVPHDEWLKRAQESEAARNIDAVLEGKDAAAVARLKEQIFEAAHSALGDEMMPEDLDRALAVKSEKYHPWIACCYGIMTCGLFNIFRPRDDETIIVLTKRERVLMFKVERPNFFGNFHEVFTQFLYYASILLFITLLPYLVMMALGSEFVDSEVSFISKVKDGFEEHVWNRLQRNVAFAVIIYASIFLAFCFWLWTKCPHDYGTRYRQSHAANRVCTGQFCLTGTKWRRQCRLRIFFGRYPEQGTLDSGMSLRGGGVAGPIPRESLSYRGGMMSFFGGGQRSAVLIAAIFGLQGLTILDAIFSYVVTPAQWVQQVSHMQEFCKGPGAQGPEHCGFSACANWANKQSEDTSFGSFCFQVHWFDDANNQDDILNCRFASGGKVPCCGGCTHGAAQSQLSNSLEFFKTAVGILTDLGTVAFSFGAAAAALHREKDRDHIDVRFGKRPRFRSELANFALTQPLALDFFERIFAMGLGTPTATGPDVTKAASEQRPYGNNKPGLRRAERYDDLDPEEDTNFRDVSNFALCDDEHDWEEFLGSKELVEKGSIAPKVNVPRKCLGIGNDEQVLAGWAEVPEISLLLLSPYILGFLVLFFMLMCAPEGDLMKKVESPFGGEGIMPRFLACLTISGSLLIIALATLYTSLFLAVRHAVVLTKQRVFYARHREPCFLCCICGVDLRVDTFRHDHEVSYGSLRTTPPTLYMRATGRKWTPGAVVMQPSIYGLIRLNRQRGNALNVYQIVSQLTNVSQCKVINEKDIEAAGVSVNRCKEYVQAAMERKLADVWAIKHRQPDDTLAALPDVFLASPNEEPLFHWSFKEFGQISSAYNANTDVVVTTGRVYIYSRSIFKQFDCKTSLCFGACWCSCLKRLWTGPKSLQRSSSFLALPFLLSFSTETEMSPPVWHDPNHMPCKCPCFDTCCNWCTLCMTCSGTKHQRCDRQTLSMLPRRAGPKAQLWMMWHHRFNAMQPDLITSIRPYRLPDVTFDSDLWEHLGCGAPTDFDDDGSRDRFEDYRRHDMLRKIMGVVQDAVMNT